MVQCQDGAGVEDDRWVSFAEFAVCKCRQTMATDLMSRQAEKTQAQIHTHQQTTVDRLNHPLVAACTTGVMLLFCSFICLNLNLSENDYLIIIGPHVMIKSRRRHSGSSSWLLISRLVANYTVSTRWQSPKSQNFEFHFCSADGSSTMLFDFSYSLPQQTESLFVLPDRSLFTV